MLKVAFSLRMALLIASFGAVLGAGVIFWLGFYKLLHSIQQAFVPETVDTRVIAAGVMGATDAFLFGVVLIIFIALALWRATANDGSSSSLDYSSQVAPTSIIAGAATASGSHKSTGATTVFFFGMFGVMAVVAAGLVWRTQRVNHPRRT